MDPMNPYQGGKIYKIWSPSSDKIYIGSTTERTLARRMNTHRCQHRAHQVGKSCYLSCFPLFDLGDAQIALIEYFPCNSKDELNAREQYHMNANKEILINRQAAARKHAVNTSYLCTCGRALASRNPDKIRKHEQTLTHRRNLEQLAQKGQK